MDPALERFNLFFDKLKSPANTVMLVLGVLMLVDLYFGCPVARHIVVAQLKLFKINPDVHSFRILTVFGEFTNIDPLVKQIDIWSGAILTAVPVLSYLGGLFQALTIKRIK